MENNNRVALIIGAGDSTGAAIARRFAREGYVACLTRRSADKLQPLVDSILAEGGRAHGFASDARKEDQVAELVETIERDIGPIEVMVFNIGANVPCSILEETARKYFKIWEMACFAGFLTSQAVAKRMVVRGRGTILFTGATAGLRGSAGFAAFAGAKHGIRALAQSMARELAPQNIHVAHFVIDGGIKAHNDPRAEARGENALLDPNAIADTYLHIHDQPRSAWTWEVELRPWMEYF